MVVHYPKEGGTEDDEWIDFPIPETYVSTIKNDAIVTEQLEGLEWLS